MTVYGIGICVLIRCTLSSRWKAMLGYEDFELENSFEVFEKLIHPDDRPRVLDYVARYFNNEIDVYNIGISQPAQRRQLPLDHGLGAKH